MKFEKDFDFGVATASYQIEGAHDIDGKTPCIWDEFAKKPGKVINFENGDIACDHFHKYKEDIKLMKELGVDVYRFSIAWTRIFPKKGEYNKKGMKFYINLLKELKKNNIKASVTLYHWDLPMWAFDMGGWTNRDCVDWFLEYSKKCFEELDKYVGSWITHNEPWCAAFLSHIYGVHAPGHKSFEEGFKVAHHILLSHGKVVKLYKEMGLKNKIGITLNLTVGVAFSNSFADQIALNNFDGFNNRWYLDAVFKGKYPMDIINLFTKSMCDFSFVREGDMETISVDTDFLGINYYSRNVISYDPMSATLFSPDFSDYKKTAMGWDIAPDAFMELIRTVRKNYTDLPIYITENGSAWDDVVENGKINDIDRIDYLEKHLDAISKLNEEGLNIKGYYAWSFMDNYEWSFGYSKRFGIVYVDYKTLERIPKESYYKYQNIIKSKF